MKMTAVLLVAFLLLLFWGVLAQAQGGSVEAGDRFFKSYFIWVLGVVPLPAFKSLALLACLNLLASMYARLPRGFKFAGLWLMHVALLVLLAGSLVGSTLYKEYSGYRMVLASAGNVAEKVVFFSVDDSLNLAPVEIPEKSLAYSVNYRGRVDGVMGATVDLYSASYNPLRLVPYAFMVLFLGGAILHYAGVVRKKTKGSRLEKSTVLERPGKFFFVPLTIVLMVLLGLGACRIDEAWDSETVMDEGRARPLDSYARGFLDDLSGKVNFKVPDGSRLAAIEVFKTVAADSSRANAWPLFKVLRGDILQALNLEKESRYVSFRQLNQSRNLLELYASRSDDHPGTLEARRLLYNVRRYENVASGGVKPENSASDWKTCLEVAYHRINFALWAFILAVLAGASALANMAFKSPKIDSVANAFCASTLFSLVLMLVWRLMVAGRPPMASLYEIVLWVAMLFAAFETVAYFLCKNRTFSLIVPVTAMVAVLLFFAKFVLEVGDTFQAIPAVLNSSVFLTVHVFTIAVGFAGVILSGVVAHLVLLRSGSALPSVQNPKGSPLYSLLYGSLAFGAVFTIVGTLLGGVWADYAWGRFWGFDPKENGALFVILWTMLLLHLRAGRLVSDRGFAVLNSFNILVTFLCWFGINLLGVGLHSYGFQSGSVLWLTSFVLLDSIAVAVIYVATRRNSSKLSKNF